MERRDIQISCIAARSLAEPLEACQPQGGLRSIAPKHQEVLGRATRRAPHKEAFIPNVKILGVQSRLAGLIRAHRPRKVTHPGRPTRFAVP
jgi:hypothetical protein